ncbi:hypothetical protein UVI_02033520 [Ustilaginoidea virens]|uniref:Nudix hydrolase domain-containing protein n=1 Tax=Ustilaginoidea virens TaxID=1159556 RepID=A0A1B5L2Q6_USTVR|nr:hypothetical protein UVI_02033520 [Ustilaginoidea virens]
MKSYLDLIHETNNFPHSNTAEIESVKLSLPEGFYILVWKDEDGIYPIGYVLDRVVDKLREVPEHVRGTMEINPSDRTLQLFRFPTEGERTAMAARLVAYWRDQQTFKLLKGWRDELWPVYGRRGELLFSIERAAMGLIGTMRYGAHMTAYVVEPSAPHGLLIWVPRRAADKSTFPGMLDNTVAGGLMTDEEPSECIIREADEEASLAQDVVRRNAREVGSITYIYITDEKNVGEAGFIYPECQWLYDIELTAGLAPAPKDGEVDEFLLCDVNQINEYLARGDFKNNCALVMIDFFIRHGIITRENEPEISLIQQRMHRELPFPGPHQAV